MNKIKILLLCFIIIIGLWLLINPSIEKYTNISLDEISHEGISFMQPMQTIKKIEKPRSYQKDPLWKSDKKIYSGKVTCRMANSHNEFNCFSEKIPQKSNVSLTSSESDQVPYQCTINYGYSFDDDGYIACEECHYSPTNHRDCDRKGPVYSTCIKNPRTIGLSDIQQYVQACIGQKKN